MIYNFIYLATFKNYAFNVHLQNSNYKLIMLHEFLYTFKYISISIYLFIYIYIYIIFYYFKNNRTAQTNASIQIPAHYPSIFELKEIKLKQ